LPRRAASPSGEPAHGGDGPADSFDELARCSSAPSSELMALQAHLLDPPSRSGMSAGTARRDRLAVFRSAAHPRAGASIESALTASVQRDPRPLADALFPVMGPAIRKAIAHTLASMMETLNHAVEHSAVARRAVALTALEDRPSLCRNRSF
jgi:hypothetical protein